LEFLDGRPSVLGTYRADQYSDPVTVAAMLSGTVVAIDDVVTDPRTAACADRFRELSVGATLAVPLVTDDGPRAVLGLSSRVPRHWSADDVELARDVAARIFPAIERARAEASWRQAELALRESEQRFRIMAD